MSASLPVGSVFSIAASYGPVIAYSALTNAAPPVATSVAHGLTTGNVLEVTSGWARISGRPGRASGVAADVFSLEGYNTVSTARYSPGAGTGGVRKVLTWIPFAQTLAVGSTGGDQQYAKFKYLEDGLERQLATSKTTRTMELTFADDPTLAFYEPLLAADDDGLPRIIRLALSNGGYIYYNVQVSFNDDPTIDMDNPMSVKATLSQQGRFIRYAS